MNSNLKLLPAALLVAVLALAGCGGGGDGTPEPTPEEMAHQAAVDAATNAIAAATMAASALDTTSDDAAVSDAEGLIMAAMAAIAALPDDERAGYMAMLSTADSAVKAWRAALIEKAEAEAAQAELDRQQAEREEAEAEEARKAAEAAAEEARKMAAKLFDAIGDTPFADVAVTLSAAGVVSVDRDGGGSIAPVPLNADKMAVVSAIRGWKGSKHTETEDDDGTYTAMLYANAERAMEGPKINSGTGAGNVGFTLTNGAADVDDTGLNLATRISSPSFDHTVGSKEFSLPDPNPSGETIITILGSYYGVAGTYSCTPSGGATSCSVVRSGTGYVLSTQDASWTFTPTNPEARVTESSDELYAVYGWWLHEDEDGNAKVSAFTGYRGTPDDVTLENGGGADGSERLEGTATYNGGAAGKYAISTGNQGSNDSGHFEADATLTATFGATADSTIEGSITNFKVGDDMESRDWSVALKVIRDSADGSVDRFTNSGAFTGGVTAWTIGGDTGSDGGSWGGQLYEENDGGVPTVAVGTFHSQYGNTGNIVGAFGATTE